MWLLAVRANAYFEVRSRQCYGVGPGSSGSVGGAERLAYGDSKLQGVKRYDLKFLRFERQRAVGRIFGMGGTTDCETRSSTFVSHSQDQRAVQACSKMLSSHWLTSR